MAKASIGHSVPGGSVPGVDTSGNLVVRESEQPIAVVNRKTIDVRQFTFDVAACAASLPDGRHVVDLCRERYGFIVRFLAVLLSGQVNLLPQQRDASMLDAVCAAFADTTLHTGCPPTSVSMRVPERQADNQPLAVEPSRPAAIAFTSGTTGVPDPHLKTWGMLDAFRRVHSRYFALWLGMTDMTDRFNPVGLVATVPPWHMYGLEWTLLLPTIAPVVLHCDETFFPRDVKAALDRFETPTVLVTTPTHLRALSKSPAPANPVEITLSATSPLDVALAERIETHLRTRVVDLYGCTEIGSLATRRLTCDPLWTFFDCFDLEFKGGGLTVGAHFLPTSTTLADSFERVGSTRYRLEGRTTDIVKVGGKRESLAKLNTILLGVPGVEDAIIYEPPSVGLPATGRLAALVVAPGLDAKSIRSHLARAIDSVFIPRPIRFVATLPREATSKLSVRAIRELVASM